MFAFDNVLDCILIGLKNVTLFCYTFRCEVQYAAMKPINMSVCDSAARTVDGARPEVMR